MKEETVITWVNLIPILTFVVLLVLKLFNVVTWSWWWIFSPLWISIAGIILLIITSAFITYLTDDLFRKISKL